MINKILIANRGEIALRIIRTAREMGIKTVSIYSEVDADSLHVTMADEAYCIGPAPSIKSYLCVPAIISAAVTSGADAIHPGYGFMAERADFVEICNDHNIKFIGPNAKSMRLMGDKAQARKTCEGNNVPITPGTGLINDINEAKAFSLKVGYPVIVKATAGGGGKGMRVANSENELEEAIQICQTEAQNAFGNKEVYLEKYLKNPRHIEIQIIADKFGNVIHLGERDCSIQRRHQKLIEESPSCILTNELREKMAAAAITLTKAINYEGAGTIEFLVDENLNWYFMEMNTRIQVEHCVSEMISGVDIIKEQIKIANDEPLSFKQSDIELRGHAIECRINAENPQKEFMPNAGKIEGYIVPGGFGVRVDSHSYSGYEIPPFYDSMIGKLICYGNTREEARIRMLRTLDEYIITGIETTIPYHKKILENEIFISGYFDTAFIEKNMK